jgi:hypothetical protein
VSHENLDVSEIATVHSQIGAEVLVSIKMEGFPPGWQLRPGDQVSLMHSDSGMLAYPLVTTEVVSTITKGKMLAPVGDSADVEFSEKGAYQPELLAADGKQTTVRAFIIETTRKDYPRAVVGAREELDSGDD